MDEQSTLYDHMDREDALRMEGSICVQLIPRNFLTPDELRKILLIVEEVRHETARQWAHGMYLFHLKRALEEFDPDRVATVAALKGVLVAMQYKGTADPTVENKLWAAMRNAKRYGYYGASTPFFND